MYRDKDVWYIQESLYAIWMADMEQRSASYRASAVIAATAPARFPLSVNVVLFITALGTPPRPASQQNAELPPPVQSPQPLVATL